MATKTLEDAAFWNGFVMADASLLGAGYGPGSFPSEFPYEIDSSVESLLSSTETTTTESGDDEAEDGEEDFLAELTRRLTRSSPALEPQKSTPPSSYKPESLNQKLRAVSGSPKSTLNGWPPSRGGGISRDVSPNGGSTAPSPPLTPFVADKGHPDWDLIYAAAGQVARLRLSSEAAKMQPRQQPVGAPVCTIKSHSPVTVAKASHSGFFPGHTTLNDQSQTNQYQNAMWAKSVKMSSLRQQSQLIQGRIRDTEYESINGRYGGGRQLPQSAWPSLQTRCLPQQNQNKPNLRGLSINSSTGVKRECTGTGVFLPRRYENPAPEPRKRSGCSTVLLPAKVVQALNLNLDEPNAHPAHAQQRFTDYDLLMAKRNAALYAQQRRNLRPEGNVPHEVRLPQEWTY